MHFCLTLWCGKKILIVYHNDSCYYTSCPYKFKKMQNPKFEKINGFGSDLRKIKPDPDPICEETWIWIRTPPSRKTRLGSDLRKIPDPDPTLEKQPSFGSYQIFT